MLRSYLLTLYRSLVRHKLFSALNVLGLAIGMAVFLTLTLATRFEFSYDQWIPNAELTYRFSGDEHVGPAPGGHRPHPRPGAAQPARRLPPDRGGNPGADRRISGPARPANDYEEIAFVDVSFFDFFDLPFVAAVPSSPLRHHRRGAHRGTMARKYFGDQPASASV